MLFADNKSKSKNGNEQYTVYMINSLVMYGKQKTSILNNLIMSMHTKM